MRGGRVLKFGKYRGCDIRDVPDDYIQWLYTDAEQTVSWCKAELERRENDEEASMTMMERIIKSGYRDLAKKYHPDAGGDANAMKELNASYDALNTALDGSRRT